MLDHLCQHCAIVDHSVLRGLESGPSVAKEAKRCTVQPGYLDDQASIRLQGFVGVNQRARRIIVVLQVMPHSDQVKLLAAKFLLIEQTSPELYIVECCQLSQVN